MIVVLYALPAAALIWCLFTAAGVLFVIEVAKAIYQNFLTILLVLSPIIALLVWRWFTLYQYL